MTLLRGGARLGDGFFRTHHLGRVCGFSRGVRALDFGGVLDLTTAAVNPGDPNPTTTPALTSGYGLVTIVRWFWWRVNAWSEIAALAGSAAATWAVRSRSPDLGLGGELLVVVGLTTDLARLKPSGSGD